MPVMQTLDEDDLHRMHHAHGGSTGAKPIPPPDPTLWRPGMPVHWQEQTRFIKWKHIFVRFFSSLQIAVGILYLQYRARRTIGIFAKSRLPHFLAYQIIFYLFECCSVFSNVFRTIEVWNVMNRNCVDFRRIPNSLIAPYFSHSPRAKVPPQFCNYPSVGVFIPCYNEDVDLVAETVLAALKIDYPPQLLTVYLCDDGKDPHKRAMVSHLRKRFRNLYYVIRPQHVHAKAGNLNYALERTTSDLVVTLDADFIARPFLLQRLLSYYFVWNPKLGMYEFNNSLAVVQTPQHFRNLSPYDADVLDQRSIFFIDLVLTGKDWFNASTMVGTTNLINRNALKHANFYPYHSITEDTGLTIIIHGLGYRTYYVNESLATGLATATLWGNLRQRARWLKGDFQILFSRHGPLSQKGLSIQQRMLYLNMSFSRLMSVVHMGYDVSAILLLVFGIAPLDAKEPLWFLGHIAAYVLVGMVFRFVINIGGGGLDKSENGNVAFEAIFRYTTFKGLIMSLFRGDKLDFKVTDKASAVRAVRKKDLDFSEDNESHVSEERFVGHSKHAVLGRAADDAEGIGLEGGKEVDGEVGRRRIRSRSGVIGVEGVEDGGSVREPSAVVLDVGGASSVREGGSATTSVRTDSSEEDEGWRRYKRARAKSAEEREERRRDVGKNLKRVWFNAVMAVLLTFAIVKGVVRPPEHRGAGKIVEVDGVAMRLIYNNLLPLGLALGFAISNVLPHVLAVYLCFIPYLNGWMMTDTTHGRCDQWAVHPKTGKLFVPFSFISLLSLARVIVVSGAVAIVTVATLKEEVKMEPVGS